jgi:hypothetical protein
MKLRDGLSSWGEEEKDAAWPNSMTEMWALNFVREQRVKRREPE